MLTVAISGRLRAASMNVCVLLGEELDVLAGAVLEHERHAARGADAGNGRRREDERLRLGQLGQLRVDAC